MGFADGMKLGLTWWQQQKENAMRMQELENQAAGLRTTQNKDIANLASQWQATNNITDLSNIKSPRELDTSVIDSAVLGLPGVPEAPPVNRTAVPGADVAVPQRADMQRVYEAANKFYTSGEVPADLNFQRKANEIRDTAGNIIGYSDFGKAGEMTKLSGANPAEKGIQSTRASLLAAAKLAGSNPTTKAAWDANEEQAKAAGLPAKPWPLPDDFKGYTPKTAGMSESKFQAQLEKEYKGYIIKELSNRSGGLGIEDGKVNQAIHLQQAINNAYDPKTDTYTIPPSLHVDLATGLARLISPTGQPAQQLIEELRQKTAKEGLSGALIYLGFDPKEIGGTTQSVSKFFADQIKRQGYTAQENRDTYMDGLRDLAPSQLSEDVADKVRRTTISNNYTDSLPGGKNFDIKAAIERRGAGTVPPGVSASRVYNSVAEANAAKLPKGTEVQIKVNGKIRKAVIN